MGTVTGMSDEMPTGVDVRQADDAIRNALARLRIPSVCDDASAKVDVEWLLGQLCAGRIAVARAAARLLAEQPGQYAGPEHRADLETVRGRLDEHLELRAVRAGLPPATCWPGWPVPVRRIRRAR
jgi:hypothetical protein